MVFYGNYLSFKNRKSFKISSYNSNEMISINKSRSDLLIGYKYLHCGLWILFTINIIEETGVNND
jgi:hypothetical protein